MTRQRWFRPTIGKKIGGFFVAALVLTTLNVAVFHTVLQEWVNYSKTSLIADDFHIYTKRIASVVLSANEFTHRDAGHDLDRTAQVFEEGLLQLRSAHPLDDPTVLAAPNNQIVALTDQVNKDWAVFRETARDVLDHALSAARLEDAEDALLASVLALGHGLTLHGQTTQERSAIMLYCIFGVDALLLLVVFAVIKLQVIRPIVQLSQMSRRLAAGDYGTRMVFESGDEIGELVASFNSAAHETQRLIGQIGREEAELAERENLLRTIFDAEPECVALLDGQARFQKINRMGLAMLDAESSESLVATSLYRFVVPEHLAPLRALVERALAGNGGCIDIELSGVHGRQVWAEAHLVPLHQEPAKAVALLAIIHDISERKRHEDSLRLLQRAVESSSNGIVITDLAQSGNPIIYVNPAFERITGYTAAEAVGTNGRLLQRHELNQPGLEEIRAALREQREGHAIVRNFRKDGSLFWNELHIAPVHDEHGRVTHFVGIQNDISDRMRYEEQLAHQAKHDTLTGLPNRSLLEDRLHQALIHANRNQRQTAVVFVDLDHFKFINDSLGHDLGDRLLVAVADRLTECLREGDTVARQGGDEFVLILSDAQDPQAFTQTLQRVIESIAQPINLDGRDLVVTCSVGASVYPVDGKDPQSLLKNADIAMYRAKEQGRNNFQFYTPEMNARITERLTLEGSLRLALERQEFLVHFQPQVNLRSGQITGVEALVRWQHPETGLIAPGRFIPLAEETGLIVPLGEWVMTTACAQAKAWLDAGLRAPVVAVNISAVQFRQSDLVATVERVLAATGLAPQYLELELTESLVMHQTEQFIATMARLKALGVQMSLDDFGTGYSSLSYLKRFPIDKLKIDQSFVREITTDAGDAAIARSVIALAHSLGLTVIAEGVEDEAQLAYLRAQQCDEIQGYYFSRPVPAEEVTAMLQQGRMLASGRPVAAAMPALRLAARTSAEQCGPLARRARVATNRRRLARA